jgi:protein SCO1/2
MKKIFLLLAVLLGGTAVALAHQHETPAAETHDLGSHPDPEAAPTEVGGPFSLTDHTGKAVTEKDYAGKYLLAFFGFTYCPDICPTELQTAVSALDLLGPEKSARVQPLFITIDPERDTPEVLATYVQQFSDTLVGLTGTQEQIAAVAHAYKVYYGRAKAEDADEASDEYMMDHTSFLYLMGPDGKFIKVFPAGTSVDDLAKALSENVK